MVKICISIWTEPRESNGVPFSVTVRTYKWLRRLKLWARRIVSLPENRCITFYRDILRVRWVCTVCEVKDGETVRMCEICGREMKDVFLMTGVQS